MAGKRTPRCRYWMSGSRAAGGTGRCGKYPGRLYTSRGLCNPSEVVQRSTEDIQVRIVADFVEETPRSGSSIEGIIDEVALLEVLCAELALGVVNHALAYFVGVSASRFECSEVVVKADRFPSAGGSQHQDMAARNGIGQGQFAQAKRHKHRIVRLLLFYGII